MLKMLKKKNVLMMMTIAQVLLMTVKILIVLQPSPQLEKLLKHGLLLLKLLKVNALKVMMFVKLLLKPVQIKLA